MTLQINDFIFLVSEVVALTTIKEENSYYYFYLCFQNGKQHQLMFSKSTQKDPKLFKQIDALRNKIRSYMSDSHKNLKLENFQS